MDKVALQAKWSEIDEQNSQKLQEAIKAKVTRTTDNGDSLICNDLLEDLGWAMSWDKFKKFIQGEKRMSCDAQLYT